MKLAILFVGVNACNPLLTWDPGSGIAATDTGDTGFAPDTSAPSCDTGSIDDCAAWNIQDQMLAFEGTIPGTESVQDSEDCGGTCYRCVYLDSDKGIAYVFFYVDEPRKYDVVTFQYLKNDTGSYTMDMLYLWTSVESDPARSDVLGYLVVEPNYGSASVVSLSECVEP
jgi:hypothetical protein